MWRKYGREATDGNIIRRMRLTYWITKASDTHWEYVILVSFPRLQGSRERVECYIVSVHFPSRYWLYVLCLPARIIEDVRFTALQTFKLRSQYAAGRTTKVVAVRFPVTASDFSFQSAQTGSGAHPISVQWVPKTFSSSKAAGAWNWPLTSI